MVNVAMFSKTSRMKVLVVSSGDATGLNFCRSLRVSDKFITIGVDTTVEDHLTSEADERLLLPHPTSGEFLEALTKLCHKKRPDLLYAADTNAELQIIFRARKGIPAPTFLPQPGDIVAEDKWDTWKKLKAAGVPVHANALIQSPADIQSFMTDKDHIWLRRRTGSGGAGSIATDKPHVARAWIDHHNGWGQFIAAELLTKRTATWMGIWWQGVLQVCQMRERSGWKYQNLSPSGVTGITAVQKTMWDPELHELAIKCVRAVSNHPHGILGVDFTWDKEGVPRPTEVQPSRFYSSVHFLTAAGLNLPEYYCRIAKSGPLSDAIINPLRNEIYWVKSVDMPGKLVSADEWHAVHIWNTESAT